MLLLGMALMYSCQKEENPQPMPDSSTEKAINWEACPNCHFRGCTDRTHDICPSCWVSKRPAAGCLCSEGGYPGLPGGGEPPLYNYARWPYGQTDLQVKYGQLIPFEVEINIGNDRWMIMMPEFDSEVFIPGEFKSQLSYQHPHLRLLQDVRGPAHVYLKQYPNQERVRLEIWMGPR